MGLYQKGNLGISFYISLKNIVLHASAFAEETPSLVLNIFFSLDIPLMALIIAKVALYFSDSMLW